MGASARREKREARKTPSLAPSAQRKADCRLRLDPLSENLAMFERYTEKARRVIFFALLQRPIMAKKRRPTQLSSFCSLAM
jgi:hypothetical protein